MPQGKTETFRSRRGNWSMDVWQPKTSRATRRRHIVIGDPVPEVQFSDEEADTTIFLHARRARRNDSVMHSDTLTMRLMYLSYCLLIAKTWLGKGAHEKGKRHDLSGQLDPGNINQCFMRALISVNSITGLDNISAFFGKRKWKAVQLLQPMEGTSELRPVSRERVISIPGEL